MKSLICAVTVLAVSTTQAATIHVDAANCPPSDCCTAHGGPGCDDMACETAVCAVEPSCCTTWDTVCASLAEALCDPLCGGACPGGGTGTELDPFCCIQNAIDDAVDTDEIVVAPGTYFETINFLGKAVWLHSSDGAEVTIIDAQATGRVVTCTSGEGLATVLDGFTITGGLADLGGAMYNDGSSPTVTNCLFSGNSASIHGAGMYNCSSSPTVTNCRFTENSAMYDGGGC